VTSPRRLARLAGVLYLLMAILGGAAHLGIRDSIHVPGDGATTAANVVANSDLFRLAFVADLAMATLFVFVGLAFYRLLRDVERTAAGAMVVFVIVGAAMILVNLLFHHAALLVASDASYASALGVEGSEALVLLLLDMHRSGYAIAGIFFGLWLLPLGYLAVTSRMFPRLLGVLLVVAGASWIVDTLVGFAAPGLPDVVHLALTAPQFVELAMIVYLLVKGVRTPPSASHLATTQANLVTTKAKP
jgi:hypothetical protein